MVRFLIALGSAIGAAFLVCLGGCSGPGRLNVAVKTPTIEISFDGATGQASINGSIGGVVVASSQPASTGAVTP